jgi:hypothetical protein
MNLAHELRQKDLARIFGSESIVTEILNNKRALNKSQRETNASKAPAEKTQWPLHGPFGASVSLPLRSAGALAAGGAENLWEGLQGAGWVGDAIVEGSWG